MDITSKHLVWKLNHGIQQISLTLTWKSLTSGKSRKSADRQTKLKQSKPPPRSNSQKSDTRKDSAGSGHNGNLPGSADTQSGTPSAPPSTHQSPPPKASSHVKNKKPSKRRRDKKRLLKFKQRKADERAQQQVEEQTPKENCDANNESMVTPKHRSIPFKIEHYDKMPSTHVHLVGGRIVGTETLADGRLETIGIPPSISIEVPLHVSLLHMKKLLINTLHSTGSFPDCIDHTNIRIHQIQADYSKVLRGETTESAHRVDLHNSLPVSHIVLDKRVPKYVLMYDIRVLPDADDGGG